MFGKQTILVYDQFSQSGSSLLKQQFVLPQLGEMGGEGLLELVRWQDAGWKGSFAQEIAEEEAEVWV